MARFVHLHVHSQYSLLDGACRVADLAHAAAEQEVKALALTDHGVLFGAVDFYKTCKAGGVKPILGCEAYITIQNRFVKSEGNPYFHLLLLAENEEGYQNLSRLSTLAHLEGFYSKPRIDKEILARYSKGLIGLGACLQGEVMQRLVADDLPGAVQAAGSYADIFGKDRFFLEFMDHGIPEQRQANRSLAALARKTGLRVVATNDVHYMKREHAEAHEVLLCMQTQTVLSDPKHMRYHAPEFYYKSAAEMERLSAEFPGAVEITAEIADRCNVQLDLSGKVRCPRYEPPEGLTAREYLIRIGFEGIRRLYGLADPAHPADARAREIVDRFMTEVDVIEKAGFLSYFLVVWDYVDFAKRRGIPVGPGRGSGCGSLVAYVMGITAVDPLRYNLIFERFLNLERVSPPDFDIDFCQARRGEVIQYVKEKYGVEHFAQIVTFGSLNPKTVIRDVGRVLEIPLIECDRLAKMVPEDPKIKSFKDAFEANAELRDRYKNDPSCARICDYGFVLEGLLRNAGVHAAGVVIGDKPLIEILPLGRDKSGEPVTQFTKDPVGELGLLKMDFLGLQTLTVIREALDQIREIHGAAVDLDNLGLDDEATYRLLNSGRTVGLFQLESGGMQNLIRENGIANIEELIAVIALYRPGPMNMLPEYIARKKGRTPVTYDHPLLEPVLKDTFGVMVYQEQVQKAANVLAGYTLGGADELRRAMSKKKKEEMEKHRALFVAGCHRKNGIPAERAQSIFDRIAGFAEYGFNKAHAAGYAIVSYQTAWLKANYPAEFMCALISCDFGNYEKMAVFTAEAADMGLAVLPPDVNAAGLRFRPEGATGIRFGLAGVKNVGEGAAEAILRERRANGPFRGLVDFCMRADSQAVNRKALESLIRCGAFDSIGANRARLFNGLDWAIGRAAASQRDRRVGQGSLFGEADVLTDDGLPASEPWSAGVLLAGEKELLGLYMTGHPLSEHELTLRPYQTATAQMLAEAADGFAARCAGIVSRVDAKMTKNKDPMAVIQVDTFDGTIEVVAYPRAYQELKTVLQPNVACLLCGTVRRRDETHFSLAVNEVYPVEEVAAKFAQATTIRLAAEAMDEERFAGLLACLKAHPGPASVTLTLEFSEGTQAHVACDATLKCQPDRALLTELEAWAGRKGVAIRAHNRIFLKTRERGDWRNGGERWRDRRT